MLDIGFQELLVIMILALLVFGPDRLPELGRRLGRAMREFRRASDEFRSTIETNLHISEDAILPPSASDPLSPTAEASAATPLGAQAGLPGDPTPSSEPFPGGALASAGDSALGESVKPEGESVEPFWTARGGRLLHRSACAWRNRVPEADRVALKAATDGWDLGLLPCPVCDPREAEVTS